VYKDRKVAVVVPAYNEETLIRPALETIPGYVDVVYVVDDGPVDGTLSVIEEVASRDQRVVVIEHNPNRGVGAAIVSGYKRVLEDEVRAGFLGVVVAVAEAGAPVSVGAVEGGGVVGVASGGLDSVAAALRMCLGGGVEEFREYYRLVDPVGVWAVDRALGWAPRRVAAAAASEWVVAVSCLCGDPAPLLGVLGGGGAVLLAGRPWLWAPGLGLAVAVHEGVSRMARALERVGVGVYSDVEELVLRVRAAGPLSAQGVP